MYAELIEPEYAKEWATAVALAGQGAKGLPKAVEVRNRLVKRIFDRQNETVQATVKQVVDTRYEKAMADYQRAYIDAPRTREQKEWALNSAFSILQPMVDMVSSRFGVAATLMMAGPMPSKGGEVDVLSVHSGELRGLVNMIWPEYDRAGYDTAANSLIGFAQAVFRKFEAFMRSLVVC
ncbi:hypothetical protein FA95DRAFT_1613867 [Auriscalpium vulgare]|uniref:Uncharacterized protein n=1 Tax=Auriscalpium vulgare TaxID=40419 RepID=A0ACB8R1L3_9AGAM|nr:hypothetical protein FA95DRAFT_1613867 [Auriscalpium vulgare]